MSLGPSIQGGERIGLFSSRLPIPTIEETMRSPKAEPAPRSLGTTDAIFFHPSRTVCRRTVIIVMRAILHPFPNVAMHLIESEGIRLEGVYRNRLSPILTLRPVPINVVTIIV